jgi:curli production assembly/transport component CsgG
MEAGNGHWFTVLEREGLTDLMNERKIINQTREIYSNDPNKTEHTPTLPPMLYAPILLEGGVIAYETNLLTGGLGANYLGIGGSTQFSRDTVTTMLRAVSIKNGAILNNVDARKTVFSIQLDSGLYQFVSFQKLLQLEAGVSSNEPPQMAVMESIEACVYAMIMEGVVDKLWAFKDQSQVRTLIDNYLKQRDSDMVADVDNKGRVVGLKPVAQ